MAGLNKGLSPSVARGKKTKTPRRVKPSVTAKFKKLAKNQINFS